MRTEEFKQVQGENIVPIIKDKVMTYSALFHSLKDIDAVSHYIRRYPEYYGGLENNKIIERVNAYGVTESLLCYFGDTNSIIDPIVNFGYINGADYRDKEYYGVNQLILDMINNARNGLYNMPTTSYIARYDDASAVVATFIRLAITFSNPFLTNFQIETKKAGKRISHIRFTSGHNSIVISLDEMHKRNKDYSDSILNDYIRRSYYNILEVVKPFKSGATATDLPFLIVEELKYRRCLDNNNKNKGEEQNERR